MNGKRYLSGFCVSALCAIAQADILVGYDFDDSTGIGTQAPLIVSPRVSASNFNTGSGLINNVYTKFAPIDGLDAQGKGFGTTNLFSFGGARSEFGFVDMNNADNLSSAIAANDYITFTVSPQEGESLSLTSLSFRTYAKQLNNAAERWALFSSIDGFTNGDEIATGQTTDILTWDSASNNIVVILSDERFQHLDAPVEFRIYVYGGNANSNSATAFDKVVLNGTTIDTRPLYEDHFDNDGLATNMGFGGGAVNRTIHAHQWTDDGDAKFVTSGTSFTRRALMYSENSFQSDTGFKLTVNYTVGSIGDLAAHNFSFGLISSDTDLSSYSAYNPFRGNSSVYSIGANITSDGGTATRGLNFTDGSTVTNLDQSGSRAQFKAGEICKVTLEIGVGGYWCYRINDVYEASGALPIDFDLSKEYHVAIYGQDDHGGGKSIQSIKLEKAYALGQRARDLRGSWNGGQGDVENIKHLKTLDSTIARLNEGATGSGNHNAPHNILESIALGLSVVGGDPIASPVPTWGDLSLSEPENDPFLNEILGVRNAGIGVKVYSNSENFVGSNTVALETFTERWKAYCDTDPGVQAFINSQPYHTGIWNSATQQYEDATATYPNRKYMFCYAEYVLKDFALRYGPYVSSWIFDSADDMVKNGDNGGSGLIEDQRIFQAFANAVHAGNPEIPVAFNRGRLGNDLINDPSFPFARATRFDDFTFGHAFNGNNDHSTSAVNPTRGESIFDSNYRHVAVMTTTNGYVQKDGQWDWDDYVVGNFHSKLGTASWQFSGTQAWTQEEFNQWNLEAMQAGGHMTWEGSVTRGSRVLRGWAITQLELLDAHLAEFQNPGPPSWARKYTWLPEAVIGRSYNHVLVEGEDFWDPEGDDIISVSLLAGAPSWLNISESPANSGNWVFSGAPTDSTATEYKFELIAHDMNGEAGTRAVEIQVLEAPVVMPIANWKLNDGASSSAQDSTGNGYNGTITNASSVSGIEGTALDFDGSSTEVSLPVAAFAALDQEVTISLWTYGDASLPKSHSLLYAVNATGNPVLNIHLPWGNSTVYWDAGWDSGVDRISAVASSSQFMGNWNHWVFVKNATAGTMEIYHNGNLFHSETGKTKSITGISAVTFGSQGGSLFYSGAVDDVALFDVALTAQEVADLYSSY